MTEEMIEGLIRFQVKVADIKSCVLRFRKVA